MSGAMTLHRPPRSTDLCVKVLHLWSTHLLHRRLRNLVDNLRWKMWRPEAQVLNAEPLRKALDRLPHFTAVASLSGEHLQAIIKKAPKAKSPGRDAWTYGDLKRLHLPALLA